MNSTLAHFWLIRGMTAMGTSETFLVTEPEYFRAVGDMYTEENVPLFRNWLLQR